MERWTVPDHLSERDFALMSAALADGEEGRRVLSGALGRDEDLLDAALTHPEVVRRVLASDPEPGVLAPVASPELYFAVLIAKARLDLADAASIPEWTDNDMAVPLFDADAARAALDLTAVRRYLAHLLASYVHSRAGRMRVSPERAGEPAHYLPFYDLDLESMLRLAAVAPEPAQPAVLCRAADLALFLTGLFPRHVVAQSGEDGLATWEKQGQGLYHAAAVRFEAARPRWSAALDGLAEQFHPSRRALNFVAQRYLRAS